ncbi:MAG: hypothetical protein ABI870_05185 [Rhodanobacter sp.]
MSDVLTFSHHRKISIPWLLLGGYTVAALDMLAAIAYWAHDGVSATRILQGPATWVLGASAHAGGIATAFLGAFIYAHLLWGVVALYHVMARRHPLLWRRPFVCGAIYGAIAYGAIFQIMVPLLTRTHPWAGSPQWILTCLAVYMTLVGIPCALFSRAATDVA